MLRNKNYHENTKYNMDLINHELDKMMAEDVNPHPHDFVSIFNGISFPELNHEVLNLPGKFKQREPVCGFTNDGKLIFMDQVTTVSPDNDKIKRELVANHEYLIGKLKPAKKERLLDYDVSLQVILKKPSFHVVISDYDYGIDEECMKIDGSAIRVLYRSFNKDVIYETLNNLSNIDYFKHEMCGYDYMKWAQCIAFSRQPYAQDYLKKSVDLFTRIEKINYEYQKNLHLSLKVMIKSQFENEKTVRRLLTMITKAIPHDRVSDVCGHEAFLLEHQKSINVLQAEISRRNVEFAGLEAEFARRNAEFAGLEAEFARRNAEFAELEAENIRLKMENEELKLSK